MLSTPLTSRPSGLGVPHRASRTEPSGLTHLVVKLKRGRLEHIKSAVPGVAGAVLCAESAHHWGTLNCFLGTGYCIVPVHHNLRRG